MTGSRSVRARAAAFALLLVALLSGGCALIDAVQDTEAALEAEGFRDASVDWASYNGVETVTVNWSSSVETPDAAQAEGLRAAGVIWRVAPVHFDLVQTEPVTYGGDFVATRVFPRAQLEDTYGPRPPGLDQDLGELADVRAYVVGFVVVLLLGLALVAVVVVVLVRAARRRRAAQPPRAYPPPGSGWAAPPPPQWQSPQQPPAPGWPPPPGDPWQAPPG
jgi:hypothetical protein